MTETLVDLIRHGEPVGGRAYRGHGIDDPLSERGWAQMWAAVGDYDRWDWIVTSPLLRCREFADALAERRGVPVQVEDSFKEVGFGSWEGRTPQQLQRERSQEFDAFYDDPVNCRPPGAEPLNAFIARVALAYDGLIGERAGSHGLIIAHAGVIRALLARVVEAPPSGMYRIQVSNGGISRIRHRRRRAVVELLNGALSG